MKKVYWAALLALPLLALPARANWFPFRVEAGGNVYLRVNDGQCPGGCQLGPWYQYFPYEAHFQSAAPIGFPYWPGPQTLPPQAAAPYQYQQFQPAYPPAPAAAPVQGAQLQQARYDPPYFQPVGYSYQAPSYWYGR